MFFWWLMCYNKTWQVPLGLSALSYSRPLGDETGKKGNAEEIRPAYWEQISILPPKLWHWARFWRKEYFTFYFPLGHSGKFGFLTFINQANYCSSFFFFPDSIIHQCWESFSSLLFWLESISARCKHAVYMCFLENYAFWGSIYHVWRV